MLQAIHVDRSSIPGGNWSDCGGVDYTFNYESVLPDYRKWTAAGTPPCGHLAAPSASAARVSLASTAYCFARDPRRILLSLRVIDARMYKCHVPCQPHREWVRSRRFPLLRLGGLMRWCGCSFDILIYSGDADFILNHMGSVNWIAAATGLNASVAVPWQKWLGSDGQVAGYYEMCVPAFAPTCARCLWIA